MRLFALIGLAITASPAQAAPPPPAPAAAPPAKAAPKPVHVRSAPARPARKHAPAAPPAAPVWSIDKAASRISFRGALPDGALDGVFKKWDAQVAFDPNNLKGSRLMIVAEAGSALTGQPVWDQALATPGWMWPKKYPKAVFVSRHFTQTGPGEFRAIGELRWRGVARRAVLFFNYTPGQDGSQIDGSLLVDRSAFGIGPPATAKPPAAKPGSVPALANELVIRIRLSAKKAL